MPNFGKTVHFLQIDPSTYSSASQTLCGRTVKRISQQQGWWCSDGLQVRVTSKRRNVTCFKCWWLTSYLPFWQFRHQLIRKLPRFLSR